MTINFIHDWRAYIAEFLGSFVFIFIALVVVLEEGFYGSIGVAGQSAAIGLSYLAMVYVTGHVAGGYLNPVVTIALWFSQKLSGVKTILFVICQLAASFSAAWVISLIFGREAYQFGLGLPPIGFNISLQSAVLVETILTAGIVFAVFGTMVDRNGPVSFGPLVLGFLIIASTLVAMPISGAIFNPARVVGAAVLAKSYTLLVVWVVGPLAGSLFGIIYDLVFLKKFKKK